MFVQAISLLMAAAGAVGADVDYATAAHRTDWHHHPVCGDPSFDSFERLPGNPVYRGSPPYEWPVNGFLFEDPKSCDWFIYAGLYAKDYAMTEDLCSHCMVFRSKDRGASWEALGSPFPDEPFRFAPDTSPVGNAPDVSVAYADGRYHMIYDWATADTRWQTVADPPAPADSGVGYAWAERPEGPFTRTAPPVYSTRKSPLLMGKYRRGYAASIVKREHDWMVLFMMDSGPNFSWGLFGTTSARPEGPYSTPVPLRTVEGDYFHPPLMEFFPAFQHDGYVYAPATSVALNRDFQAVFRAPAGKAHLADAWEICQLGSVWHAEPVPNEHYGIWGQTFTGFVDKTGSFNVMFPSRDPRGIGTINLARRPWNKPYRECGFVLGGHEGAGITFLKQTFSAFAVRAALRYTGEVALLWGAHGPLGPDKPIAGATVHPLSLTRQQSLVLTANTWRITKTADKLPAADVASGILSKSAQAFSLTLSEDSPAVLVIDNEPVWQGHLDIVPGAVGLLVSPNSALQVEQFTVSGERTRGVLDYLCTEAILGAGSACETWNNVEEAGFKYGTGALSLKPGARAKWNVEGAKFELWAPTGPDYGRGTLLLDGTKQAPVDFHADKTQPSHVVWTSTEIPDGPHAVVLLADDPVIPLDVLSATIPAK